MAKKQLERDTEDEYCSWLALTHGGLAHKFKHVVRRGAADRIVFLPNGKVFFIEFKRTEKDSPAEHQLKYSRMFSKLGYNTYFCYTLEQAISATEEELGNG